MSTSQTSSLGHLVGTKLRQLREERNWTQERLTAHAQVAGLPWLPDVVSDLESGRREEVTVGELVALTWILRLQVTDWFEGEGWMWISPHARLDFRSLRAVFGGQASHAIFDVVRPLSVSLEAEEHAAKRLGVDPFDIIHAARELWDRRLTDERDQRLGDTSAFSPDELRARRGRVTRTLLEELKQAIDHPQVPRMVPPADH